MSRADRVPLGSQINVSLGGKTELCVMPARHCGIGEIATGLAVPCPDEPISPDNRAVDHLAGSKSPPRPRTAEGPWLKVSQNAGALKLQFADETNVSARTSDDARTSGESAIAEASVLAIVALAP